MKDKKISLVHLAETANVRAKSLDSLSPLDRALANFGMNTQSLVQQVGADGGAKTIPDANIRLDVRPEGDNVTIYVDAIDPNYGVASEWEGIVGEEFSASAPAALEEVAEEETNDAERVGMLIVHTIEELAQEDPNWDDPYEEDEDTMRDLGYRRPRRLDAGGWRHSAGKHDVRLRFNYDWESVKDPKSGKTYCFSVTGEAFGEEAWDDGDYDNAPYNDFNVSSIEISKAEVWEEDAENEENLHDVEQFLTSREF